MHKTHAKRKNDIKTKLMAAICMLLVSSIMMVSTTYAWFTLSTAPEVTGINTAIGANGNLEMALMPTDGLANDKGAVNDFGITSGANDSSSAWSVKNHTWGNLVDVSDNDFYGLNKISLYPASLNVSGWDNEEMNPASMAEAMLMTPAYGADGRVSELKADTVTSTFVNGAFPQNDYLGVRAVGTASGMTDRQLAYRNYRSSASTAMAKAKNDASLSLQNNGAALANIAVAHAMDSGAMHPRTDAQALLAIVQDLLGTTGENAKTGILQYIENAYKNYIIAFAASKAAETTAEADKLDDLEFKALEGTLKDQTLDEAIATLSSYGVTLDANITTAINALKDTKATVQGVLGTLQTLVAKEATGTLTEDALYTWSEISPVLYELADTDALEVNGIPVKDVKDRINDLLSSISGGLKVIMASGGGVYADIADHCGNFTAKIKLKNLSAGGMTVEEMDAFMETKTTVPSPYLVVIGAAVTTAGAPSSAGGEAKPITDMYGYIIDLAFRTNAAASNLLLQTEAVDRIYDGEGSDETMGHGASMTFTSTSSDFTVDQMKSLMKCIRIIFFDPSDSNKIMATAMLDVDNAKIGADGISVTANIYLYTNEVTTVYEAATEGATHVEVTTVTYEAATGAEATYIADETATGGYREITGDEVGTHKKVTTVTYRQAAEGDTATHKAVSGAAAPVLLKGTDAVITALNQNQAKAVSVLVYLDGEKITNADVAASAATSMTGTMNLQFASSANLVPMEYTPLMDQAGNSGSNNENGEQVEEPDQGA